MSTHITCPQCKKQLRFQMYVCISAPAECYGNLTKHNLRRKDVQLTHAMKDTTDWICDCGFLSKGYQLRLQQLRAEVAELKELLAQNNISVSESKEVKDGLSGT